MGEGALADQLAKLADLYIAKQQGNRLNKDLLSLTMMPINGIIGINYK